MKTAMGRVLPAAVIAAALTPAAARADILEACADAKTESGRVADFVAQCSAAIAAGTEPLQIAAGTAVLVRARAMGDVWPLFEQRRDDHASFLRLLPALQKHRQAALKSAPQDGHLRAFLALELLSLLNAIDLSRPDDAAITGVARIEDHVIDVARDKELADEAVEIGVRLGVAILQRRAEHQATLAVYQRVAELRPSLADSFTVDMALAEAALTRFLDAYRRLREAKVTDGSAWARVAEMAHSGRYYRDAALGYEVALKYESNAIRAVYLLMDHAALALQRGDKTAAATFLARAEQQVDVLSRKPTYQTTALALRADIQEIRNALQ